MPRLALAIETPEWRQSSTLRGLDLAAGPLLSASAMAPATGEAAATRLLATVGAVVREARSGGSPAIALDSSLDTDLGLDSLARVELVLRLEREFAVALPEHALATSETPRDLLRFVLAGSGAGGRGADADVASLAQGEGVRPPTHVRSLTEALAYHAERQPDRLSVHLYEDGAEYPLTYRRLWDGAMRCAAGLAAQGLVPGERVAIMLATGRHYLFSFYGTMLAGGVPVPLYPPARLAAIEDHMTRHAGILANAGASLLVTLPEAKALGYLLRARVATLRSVLMPADIDRPSTGFTPVHGRHGDLAFLQYTSGSTGDPKGVMLTHANLLANVQRLGHALRQRDDDVFVSWLPLYHDMGLIGGWLATLYFGIPTVLMSPLAFLARPANGCALSTPSRHHLGRPELRVRAVPAPHRRRRDRRARPLVAGATPSTAPSRSAPRRCSLRRRASPHGACRAVRLRRSTAWPRTWSACAIAAAGRGRSGRLDRPRDLRAQRRGRCRRRRTRRRRCDVVACGQAFAGHDVRVVDAAGLELGDRHEGRLQFRGPSATQGYFRNPEATRKLIDGGWLSTGDRAYLGDGSSSSPAATRTSSSAAAATSVPHEIETAIGGLAGRPAAAASRCSRCPTRRPAPSASSSSPSCESAAAPAREELERRDPRARGPRSSARRSTTSSSPRRRRAEDLERQDPARRRARALPARARSDGAPAGVVAARAAVARRHDAAASARDERAGGGLFALRAWLVAAALAPVAVACALLAPGRRFRATARTLARLALRWSGIRVIASGLEQLPKDGAFVLAANHTSYLDAIA